ncbi:hypothetical protein HDV01_007077 [Terramyces sp. JEL0728]|nr:hypothetical protein HDV01_007077 [Terramyces sp. JEL0728]
MQKEEIFEYLNGSGLPAIFKNPVDVEQLSGGLANHVWKVGYCYRYIILKQYTGYLKYNPDIKLSENRSLIEWTALSAAYKLVDGSNNWTVPKPLHYDRDNHVIFMEYINASNLFSLLENASDRDITDDLKWISKEIESFVNALKNIQIDQEILKDSVVLQYYNHDQINIPARLKSIGVDEADINNYVQSLGNTQEHRVIFGDLWPASVLVDFENRRIAVVDWEACRVGYQYNDFIQFMGNLYLMVNGEPFHNSNAQKLFDLILKVLPDKSTNAKLRLLDMIVSLSQYDHWKVKDLKSALNGSKDTLRVSVTKLARNSTGLTPRTSTSSTKSTTERLSKTESRPNRRTTVSTKNRPQLHTASLAPIVQDVTSSPPASPRKSNVEIFPLDFIDLVVTPSKQKSFHNTSIEEQPKEEAINNMELPVLFDENLFIAVDAPKIRPADDSSASEDETKVFIPPIVELEELPLDYEPLEQFKDLNNYQDMVDSIRLDSLSRLEYFEIDEELEQALHSALETNKSVYYVKLAFAADLFWSSLPKMANLLYLQIENLDIKQTFLLTKFLEKNTQLQALNISYCDGCPYLWKLVNVLPTASSLLYLEIAGYMCRKTAKELGLLLETSRNLQYLGVYFLPGENHISFLTEALKKNKNLRHFDLLDSQLTLEDCKCICESLKYHKYLASISLAYCDVPYNTSKEFIPVVECNTVLETLSIPDYSELEEPMKFNTTLALPDDMLLSSELEIIRLRNLGLAKKCTEMANGLLQISRKLLLLNLKPEILATIFNLFMYKPISLQDANQLTTTLLGKDYIGRLRSPFKFTNTELIRRCYYAREVERKDEYNHSLIEMQKTLQDGPEWLKRFTFENYCSQPSEF